ncbi:hypothetical protein FB45DRAFT_410623 [Roridomyces roridus]|uniref:Sjogrens syndrome scleroderma autoantigen 1 family protein n=1 Tax=Roridomyces roridus TaxID=1738132 RepID=A0AAD7C4K1_9AGAR|nr:hypothetical protein FB45DRAFT_410623 [Roridomyces roridus]
MATADVSQVLAQRMLQGWVLLDETCPNCHRIPLMRSPKAATPVVLFCASCDAGPESVRPPTAESVSSSSHFSRASTPPTEVSSALSSPVFAPPPVTEESRRRAEQSDIASAEIGRRLLKGYAMLGEICPSDSCFGVPLVRPPKPGGEKDPRKECVICGTVYHTEMVSGAERLVSEKPDDAPSAPSKGKNREVETEVVEEEESPPEPSKPLKLQTVQQPLISSAPSSLLSALDESANQLESTLRGLSSRLAALTSKDPSSIGAVADAISKVVQALHQVKSLQHAEKNT